MQTIADFIKSLDFDMQKKKCKSSNIKANLISKTNRVNTACGRDYMLASELRYYIKDQSKLPLVVQSIWAYELGFEMFANPVVAKASNDPNDIPNPYHGLKISMTKTMAEGLDKLAKLNGMTKRLRTVYNDKGILTAYLLPICPLEFGAMEEDLEHLGIGYKEVTLEKGHQVIDRLFVGDGDYCEWEGDKIRVRIPLLGRPSHFAPKKEGHR